MAILIFVVMAIVVAGFVLYPLVSDRSAAEPAVSVTDDDIERAVRQVIRGRRRGGLLCPSCGEGYQAGDRFCVWCGKDLLTSTEAASELLCPDCGVVLRSSDQFCARCGYRLGDEESV